MDRSGAISETADDVKPSVEPSCVQLQGIALETKSNFVNICYSQHKRQATSGSGSKPCTPGEHQNSW